MFLPLMKKALMGGDAKSNLSLRYTAPAFVFYTPGAEFLKKTESLFPQFGFNSASDENISAHTKIEIWL